MWSPLQTRGLQFWNWSVSSSIDDCGNVTKGRKCTASCPLTKEVLWILWAFWGAVYFFLSLLRCLSVACFQASMIVLLECSWVLLSVVYRGISPSQNRKRLRSRKRPFLRPSFNFSPDLDIHSFCSEIVLRLIKPIPTSFRCCTI